MKKHITALSKYFALALLLLLAGTKTFAGDDFAVEKKKTYNKTYSLTASQKVFIKNSFGSVVINNHKSSEVKVEVTIIAKASTEERAQDILDNISINDKAGSTVSFETKIDNAKGNQRGRKGENQSMEVNYVVYMPESNPLELQNEFGKSEIGDRSGSTEITQKFGELTVGALTNVDAIRVEFGSISAEKLAGGKTSFSYSEVKVKSFSGAVKSTLEFCGKTRLGFSNEVTDVNINNSYSDIEIILPSSFNGTYDIHTSFSEFDNNTSFKIKDTDDNEDRGPKFDRDYAGKSGTGACKVKIRSSFGKIKLN